MEAKRSSSDRISTLPGNIIENILCLVPIKDAVRTSILARGWRYKWTKIPKVVFKEYLFEASNRKKLFSTVARTFNKSLNGGRVLNRCEFLFAVHHVLLLRQGPIHEFTLTMDYPIVACVEIDQIILYLSRNHTLKKFKLDSYLYKVPLSIFSLHQLTDLYLRQCILDLEPTFSGFGSLKRLCLRPMKISKKTLLHLLSNCPVLKTLTLNINDQFVSDRNNFSVTELFECLPVIERLTMWGEVIPYFVVDGFVPRELPTSLINLKYFCFKEMSLIEDYGLPFLAMLIRSSPNLEKLKLQRQIVYNDSDLDDYKIEDYTDIWLDHLNVMEITNFENSRPELPELDFVKLILAKSPVLRILRIFICRGVSNHEEMELLRILLRSPRASLAVNIFVKRH